MRARKSDLSVGPGGENLLQFVENFTREVAAKRAKLINVGEGQVENRGVQAEEGGEKRSVLEERLAGR